MKIGVIGAGRVGCSIAKYITTCTQHHTITGFYDCNIQFSQQAADFCKTKAFNSLTDLIMSSDTLFITVTDSQISAVWECIDKDLINNKIICHFSGSLSSDVFTDAPQYGAYCGSVHPVYAFSNRFDSYKGLNNALFTVQGDSLFVQSISDLLAQLGNKVCVIGKENKVLYHTALSMASNQLLGLLGTVVDILESCGFSNEQAYSALTPLMMDNLQTALQNNVEYALTGPIERGDVSTVKAHLNAVNSNEKEVYKALGKQVLKIAENKNSNNQQLSEKYRCIERTLLE